MAEIYKNMGEALKEFPFKDILTDILEEKGDVPKQSMEVYEEISPEYVEGWQMKKKRRNPSTFKENTPTKDKKRGHIDRRMARVYDHLSRKKANRRFFKFQIEEGLQEYYAEEVRIKEMAIYYKEKVSFIERTIKDPEIKKEILKRVKTEYEEMMLAG